MDNPIGHINWYAVLETKRLLLRPNTNATWITTYQIETYSTPYMYTLFATSTEHIDRYASTCAHSHTMRARTMRAYANARIRIASHANAFLMRHASIRIRYLGVFRVCYARICAHSHAMWAHSRRMRSHSHRMRSHRMRMCAFKGNLCVSGTVTHFISGCNYLSRMRLKLNHVRRRGHMTLVSRNKDAYLQWNDNSAHTRFSFYLSV